jgi:hypothetical protein
MKTGNLRRVKKENVLIVKNGNQDECSKIHSCSLRQTLPNEKWSSGYHRNKRFLSTTTLQYFIDQNYINIEELIFYLIESKQVSDFSIFGLLMKWGAKK